MAEPIHSPSDRPLPVDRQDTAVQPSAAQPTPEHPTTGEQPTLVRPTGETPYGSTGWSGTAVLPDPPRGAPATRRSPDLVALVAGVLFVLVAVLGSIGASLPGWVFGGGLVAVLLVVAGAALLASELRRVRR